MEPSSSDNIANRLASCKVGDDMESVSEFVDILRAPFIEAERGKAWQLKCEGVINQARAVLDPSLPSGKELLDKVGGELPMVVVQYMGVSKACLESSSLLIQCLATAFDPPREMFTSLFEVVNVYATNGILLVCLPIIRAISIVFPRIVRQRARFFKEAVSVLIATGRSAGQVRDDDSGDLSEEINENLFGSDGLPLSTDCIDVNIPVKVVEEIIQVAKVMRDICEHDPELKTLRKILGLFILQLLSVGCGTVNCSNEPVPDFVTELIHLLSFCNISLRMLLSKAEVDRFLDDAMDDPLQKNKNWHQQTGWTPGEEQLLQVYIVPLVPVHGPCFFWGSLNVVRFDIAENCMGCKGAVFGGIQAVYWGFQRKENSEINETFDVLNQCGQTQGHSMVLHVVSLASYLLVPSSYTQEMSLKELGLSIMTSVIDVFCLSSTNDGASQADNALELSIQLKPALQKLQVTILSTPNPKLRKQAYSIFIKIITHVLPPAPRFNTLHDLISNCGEPSLVSLMLTCVKDEVNKAWPQKDNDLVLRSLGSGPGLQASTSGSPFLSQAVLQLIHTVLKIHYGEPAELVYNLDPVVAALNFYIFLLLRESAGGTNYTHVLSREELVKGRIQWLLPLRAASLRGLSMLETVEREEAHDIQMGIASMQSSLYWCLEIVEKQLAIHAK